jgi:hypothetical protein
MGIRNMMEKDGEDDREEIRKREDWRRRDVKKKRRREEESQSEQDRGSETLGKLGTSAFPDSAVFLLPY